jgi:RNA recognition motif-containing protein
MGVVIFLGNLPYDATSNDLSRFLWEWAMPESAVTRADRATGRSKGFGFATVATPEDAYLACRADGEDLKGRRLTVSVARPLPRYAPVKDGQLSLDLELESHNLVSLDSDQWQMELLKSLDGDNQAGSWIRASLDSICLSDPNVNSTSASSVRADMKNLIDCLADNPAFLADIHPRLFEHVVAALLAASGYTDVRLTVPSSDGGVDIFASKNAGLGRSIFAIQCKRYSPGKRKVTRPEVQMTYGVVASLGVTKGAIVTTSTFTRPGANFLQEHRNQIAGVDGLDLHNWLAAARQLSQGFVDAY